MYQSVEIFVRWGVLAGQFVFAFLAVWLLLRLLPKRRPRWFHLTRIHWERSQVAERWLRVLQLTREHSTFVERDALLAGCGVTMDASWYVAGRRLLLLLLPLLILAACGWQMQHTERIWPVLTLLLVLMVVVYWDLPWLRSMRKLRAHQITKEIYMMSNQLLYLAESSLNIHTKLTRCVPFTRTLRGDLERLLAEWYHDAEQALRRFKHRIGTDDGMSFVETIDSLRLHESEEYYILLRERIQDYKEKLELAKESRKESTSYVLFVLAGIPILYTFQVFIYPWVMEGQKLFDSLG